MKLVMVLISILFIFGCATDSYDPDSCDNEIIDHTLRDEFHEIVDSTSGCDPLFLRLDFQVCDANLEQLCGYYYPNYWHGDYDSLELHCFDLSPSSVGKSLEWDMFYPAQCQDPNFEFNEDWDLWVEVWLVYGGGKTSPIYTVYIPVGEET